MTNDIRPQDADERCPKCGRLDVENCTIEVGCPLSGVHGVDTLEDWKQAASVEANARREALKENRELRAEIERLKFRITDLEQLLAEKTRCMVAARNALKPFPDEKGQWR